MKPLVASLAFGLAAATFQVLFLVPALYAILDDFGLTEKVGPDVPGDRDDGDGVAPDPDPRPASGGDGGEAPGDDAGEGEAPAPPAAPTPTPAPA